jgi:PPP family 3-phenylpropionic acid transporter
MNSAADTPTFQESSTVYSPGRGGAAIGITYAITLGAYGSMLPFIPIILHANGLSDSQVSIALTAMGAAALVAPVCFGHLADRVLAFRTLHPILLTLTALAFPLLHLCSDTISAFAVVFALNVFLIPAIALLDSFTMEFIIRSGTTQKPRTFEYYRVWGSIGFMIPALLLFFCFRDHAASTNDLLLMGLIVSLGAAIAGRALPHNTPHGQTEDPPRRQAIVAASKPPLRGVFISNFLAGLGVSIFYIAYPRLLQELGFQLAEIGLVINLGVLFEVLLMPYTSRIIRIMGIERLILLGFGAIAIRFLAVALFPTTAVVIATQLLHAPLVIGCFVAIPIFLQMHARPSFRHSINGLNITLILGVTRIIGPAIGALALSSSTGDEILSLSRALLSAGLLGVVAVVLFSYSLWKRKQETPSESTDAIPAKNG